MTICAEIAATLRPLAERATPGPWASDRSGVWTLHPGGVCGPILDAHDPRHEPHDGIGTVGDSYPRGINHPTENMAFIAACSPERVLALCEAVERSIDIDGFVGWLGSGSNATGAFPLTLSDLDRALWEYAFLRAATPTPEDR